MSPPERFPADDPREWMNRARSNLAMAKNRIPDAYLEDLCFHAQQAAEKAIKAVMIKRGIDFPYVHDLARLLSVLKESDETIPDFVGQARKLTRFATATRYPVDQTVTEQQFQEATSLAEAVIRWAEERIR
ncbi:MAG: HEPN domain-containing protein [Gemmatimonadota bacterium]|nr:HEPN domain-containing protein [Gemmatimonadota bacterium]